MEQGLISVILPIWKPNFIQLKQCIDSLINQTYGHQEIIIIYRKSEIHDNDFFELINQYNDERLKVIIGKKTGFTNSLNEGILIASGKYIARIDADDYCELNRFEKQLNFKEKTKSDIVGSWGYSISDDGKILGKIEMPVTHSEIRKKIMLHDPILHSSVLMDKLIFDNVGLYDPNYVHSEDDELWFRIMYHKYKFSNVPQYLVYIREALDSRSRGSEWKISRKYHIRAKNYAFFHYGFRKPCDILYYILTPITYFISPRFALKAKKAIGWYK
jgi:glycosyltransferase involved in cell wall biosynthesis